MLVVPREGDAHLVVPRLEAPRVVERPDVFTVVPWDETDDPVELVAQLLGPVPVAAIGDRTWARFLVELLARLDGTTFRRSSDVVGPLRAVKDAAEIAALRRASAAADRVATQLQGGAIPLIGRTEAEVSADLGRRLVDEGHHKVNFAIVAAGAQRRQPPPRAGRAGDPGRRGGPLRLRRHPPARRQRRRLLLGHHPVRVHGRAAGRLPGPLRRARGRPGPGRRQRHRGHALRGRRCCRPPGHRRGRLRRLLHPPHRPRHRHRGARGPVRRGGQLHRPRPRPRLLGRARASTCRGSGAPASRTSWWPPTPAPTPSTSSTTASWWSRPDVAAGPGRTRASGVPPPPRVPGPSSARCPWSSCPDSSRPGDV